MSQLRSRFSRIVRQLGERPCLACARMPRAFVIHDADEQREFEQQMREHARQCTCGRPFHFKRILVDPFGTASK